MTPRQRRNLNFLMGFFGGLGLNLFSIWMTWGSGYAVIPTFCLFLVLIGAVVIWPMLQDLSDKEDLKAIRVKAYNRRRRPNNELE